VKNKIHKTIILYVLYGYPTLWEEHKLTVFGKKIEISGPAIKEQEQKISGPAIK
jgi:hypothetical protein